MAGLVRLSGSDLVSRAWNEPGSPLILLDGTGADAPCLVLHDRELRVCLLAGSAVQEADIRRCRMVLVDLTGADLTGSRWERVSMLGCRLGHAVLSGATFHRVTFTRCRLLGADVGGVTFDRCVFRDSMLEPAKTTRLHNCRFYPQGTSCPH